MAKYRKKPVAIEAVQWNGLNVEEVEAFVDVGVSVFYNADVHIKTLEGIMVARVGDWIIKGVNGEFYPCKDDIFQKTYEEVKENDENT